MSLNEDSMAASLTTTKSKATKRHSGTGTVPVYKKYSGTESNSWLDPSAKLKPSDLDKPMLNVVADDYPMIIEFSNLKDNSTQVHSTVDIDQPLFRPAPKIIVFEEYAPFAIHEKKLFFRNNDSVARRIKLIQPDTPFFEMSAPRLASGEPLQQSKIAAGIEIYFVVKFKPQEVRDYAWDLVCCTEREKFIVPIRAIGTRPRITFPDEVSFGSCPVKSGTRKVLLVQNIGTSTARFSMQSLMSVFGCPGEEMVVEPGGSQMIELFFTPPTAHTFEGELEVQFTKGSKCYIQCVGTGKNVDISLSTPSLALDPSYISLVSQKTVRIRNQSENPIKFCWKSFYNEDDEEAERARLLLEIDRMEEIEHNSLVQRVQEGFYNTTDGEDFDDGEDALDPIESDSMPFSARAEEAALVRKYRNLRRALEIDTMQFVDDIFEVSPIDGQVWANSDFEITVSFRPDTAAMYTCLGFLDISGRQDRLTLNLSGQGIGPHATLSFDVLDVGDIFIHDEQKYEIFISNKGDIPAQWTFMSSLTRFGNKFNFSPKEGYLLPGQSQPLSIVFESDVLGEFCENFRFALQGNEDMLVCQIKGHVLGPTFHFDTTSIDFGIVSFDYLHSCNLRLVNSSKIAMVFNLHVPQDGTYLKKEFNLEPSEGTLGPGQHMDILLEFIPSSVKLYDYSLAVDVLGIGDIILSVPITAECIVSSVNLSTREIQFGECFIRYPYEKVLTLTNLSDQVHTKFEILPQLPYTKATATFETEPGIAVIEPKDSMDVVIRLVAEKLGTYKIPISVGVAGSQEPPIQAVLSFSVVGPKIIVDQPEVKWGAIECLKDSVRSVKITNGGLIQASLKFFLKQARSKYELPLRELILDPQDSFDLFITANLDDSVVIKDEVHILVEESDNLMVPLSAKGIGTTISCSQELQTLDMGTQLTNTTFEKRIVLENKGRRPQFLKWINATNRDENAHRAELAKKDGKEPGRATKNSLPKTAVYCVLPEEITLRPRTATTFTFKGRCDIPGLATETFVLESRIDKERVLKPIIETVLKSDIVNPLLEFSEYELPFSYTWKRGVQAQVQKKDLTLKNSTAVPLHFVLKTEVPFNLSSFEYSLQPGESTDLVVEFDPLYKDEKLAHTVEKALAISYRGHPQKDSVPLLGDIVFPNLAFESKDVKFGCVLNDTSKTVTLKVTNSSKVSTIYEWSFVPTPTPLSPSRKTVRQPAVDPASIDFFSVLPIKSRLEPGKSEEVHFTMRGTSNSRLDALAVCTVEGGPEYKLHVTAEASTVAFSLDKSVIDFGKVVVTEKGDQELFVTNNGKVTFPFKFEFANPAAADIITVMPMEGKVAGGEKFKVIVTVRPGLPDYIVEDIFVHIAHFDPVKVTAYCAGIFPACVVTLPRQKRIGPYGNTDGSMHSAWADFISLVTSNLTHPNESKFPPLADQAPPPAAGDSSWSPPIAVADSNDRVEGGSVGGGMSAAGTIPAPAQTLLEMEMHRLAMVTVLGKRIEEKKRVLKEEADAAAALLPEPVPAPVLETKGKKGKLVEPIKAETPKKPEETQGLQEFIAKHIDMKNVVVANYLCDFGNVILGQSRKKVFRINNTSHVGQLNVTLDTTLISGNGFSIEPTKIVKLVENDGVDITVKFTAATTLKIGRKVSVLPIVNKGSPTFNIVLAGNVCIPEIELSTESIAFEKVLVGRSKQIFLRLTNTCPVTAQWSFKKTPETRISITPSEGSLRAGKKTIVCVEFIPTEARKTVMETIFKVENNAKTKTFKVTGEGVGAVVKFESNSLDLGPVIPFTEGDSKIVTLTNYSDFPVEIVSLDFDHVYKEDEAALAGVDIFDRDNIYRSNIRNAGDTLPEAVYAAIAAREAAIAADETAAAAPQDEGAVPEGAIETPPTLNPAPLCTAPGPRDESLHQDFLVMGPPISGVSTLAASMAKKLQLLVRKVDQILHEIGCTDGAEGSIARRCTKSMTESEAKAVAEEEEALFAKSDSSKKAADAAFRADKKNKGKEPPPELFETPELAAYEAFMASGSLSKEVLVKLLQFRMTWEDAAYGIIIDSASSAFAPMPDVLQAIETVMPLAIVANITVSGGDEVYAGRMAALYASRNIEIDRLNQSIRNLQNAAAKAAEVALKKTKKNAATLPPPDVAPVNGEIPYAVPVGDESWVDPETGLIIELDSQDLKTLDDAQKSVYSKQLLYYQNQCLHSSRLVVAKILRIWSPVHGLKTGEPEVSTEGDGAAEGSAEAPAAEPEPASAPAEDAVPVEGEEAPAPEVPAVPVEPPLPELDLEPAVLYKEYMTTIVPMLQTMFGNTLPEPVEAASLEDGENAHVESESKDEPKADAGTPPTEGQSATPAGDALAEGAEAPLSDGEIIPPVEPEPVKPRESGIFDVAIEGDETEDAIFSTVMAILPSPKVPPIDKEFVAIPATVTYQAIKKPFPRMEPKPIKVYSIVRVDSEPAAPVDPDAPVDENAPVPYIAPEPRSQFRWIIAPNGGTVQMKILFKSSAEGKFDSILAFEIMGSRQALRLNCSGICEVPKINTDSRNVFMRRVKGITAGAAPPSKRFAIAENLYSFGPLLVFKKSDWRAGGESDEAKANFAMVQTNTDIVRISNNGRYKCNVEMGYEDTDPDAAGVFFVEPSVVELEEGETKDVRVWAFPKSVREYKNTLLACVQDNPVPLSFEVRTWGCEPSIDLDGPWNEGLKAAEEAVAACADKKLLKPLEDKVAELKAAFTIDFDRLLINKVDTRSFEIKNTSLLPVAWAIDLGEFASSENMSLSPLSGVMQVNGTQTITLSFTSTEPLMLSGKFGLRFSDNEKGLTSGRVQTRSFRATGEAYKIQAVSLNAEGSEGGGSEIDYGILRVGDYASQIVKIGNKGKYKIGYKLLITKPSMAALVSIEPSEGMIEPGTSLAEIKLTFCSKLGEVLLKANKDIKVQISEPSTGEIVETFPLYVNAHAKFNKFRIQPSKGITFGSLRFDASAKTKRIEIRNEGNFDATYVICAKSMEVDELDALDGTTLASYAYGIPAAMRKNELGDNYLERLAGGMKGGKDAKAPPAKGGKDAKGGAPAAGGLGSTNPLVSDPDALTPTVAPETPLVIGSFTVSPRIGTISPGQVIGIDIKFDPACCDVAKERLRVCYSGSDPNDALTQTIRSFELMGDSCYPAIVNDEVLNIFEEQEVVQDLGSINGDSEGGGKVDKLPPGKVVYAETEKLLAFGPVMCGQAGAKGVMERIRITNPTKVDTKVRFKVVTPEQAAELAAAKGGAAKDVKGGKDAKAAPAKGKDAKGGEPTEIMSAFTVHPEVWDIPPHEHRIVSIYFNPSEIKSYRSVFMAEVDLEGAETSVQPKGEQKGNNLIFNLAGSGTLPSVAVEQPTERAADGALSVDLGKTHIHRTSRSKLVLRNGGAMPATCLFDMSGDDDFSFPYSNSSLTVAPGERKEILLSFNPRKVYGNGDRSSMIKISVLHNSYDHYCIKMKANAYACDAVIDTMVVKPVAELDAIDEVRGEASQEARNEELVTFPELNLAEGPVSSSYTIMLKSSSQYPIKFDFALPEGTPKVFSFSPSRGHIGPLGKREVVCTFSATEPVKVDLAAAHCSLRRIEYKPNPVLPEGEGPDDSDMWGLWDDSMKTERPATDEDIAAMNAATKAMEEYLANKAAEEAKGKKGKPVGPPPEACRLQLGQGVEGIQSIIEIVSEPYSEVVVDAEAQQLNLQLNAVADVAKYKCEYEGENIPFKPTYLFQSTTHKFTFTNESNISLPLHWSFDDIKRRTATRAGTAQSRAMSRAGTAAPPTQIPCPFSVEPDTSTVGPKESKVFNLTFQPVDSDDFIYALKGETLPSPATSAEDNVSPFAGPIRMVVRGTAKRPICHFEISETPDYLARRLSNLKNENGLYSPIEAADVRVVELESTGLKTRNTFRFHIINPTSDNYEFLWEAVGDPSPFWRCVQTSGMLFGGKRIEVVFEYLPEETTVSESFFRFRLPKVGLEQLFLFSGKVQEPRVVFSTSKMDFHSVMLGGEGSSEVVYIENKEHLPFNFAFDRMSLLQLEGSSGPLIEISPKQGTVAPNGRIAITMHFKPQEEVVYNFNLICEVRRKPNKLSINVKGEGYAVHPLLQLEQNIENAQDGKSKFISLRPSPAVNYADFGSVQVLDTLAKTLTVVNNGKYNFDYLWDTEHMGSMMTLAGGKMGGTLHKGETMAYTITFAPQREASLDGAMLSFTVAGKYTYEIYARGTAVQPALRFSFMQHDFGSCFITSPGGTTVIEEKILRLVNHDPSNNINVECQFQKTRALWAECLPTVLEPGAVLDVPIRFAPREGKDYTFVVPFVVNGSSKVNVMILGNGIAARLEMVTASQRRTNFGLVNVGSEVRKVVALVNRSKRALTVQLLEDSQYGAETLSDKCVQYLPSNEFTIAPRETVSVQLVFSPNRRISTFTQDLMIRYAGTTKKLLALSGKAQGIEVALDTDSLPFGTVVMDSQKIKKLTLENGGDIGITFSWVESSFGKHFTISPLVGKVLPNSEIQFDVTFRPVGLEEDINQSGMMLLVPGVPPLSLTCTGACIPQPAENTSTLQFNSLARKAETKSIKMSNPTDKDWFLSPSLNGENWRIPNELKVPAKGAADMAITYYPLTMSPAPPKEPADGEPDSAHRGQLFVSLPDGTAQLYKLRGYAGPPECSGQLTVETPAKQPAQFSIKVNNWLSQAQKLQVAIELLERPSPATFVIAANAVEVGPNGTKEFPLRFLSFTEGLCKARITFTNPVTGEYAFYELTARATMPEVLETITMESSARQSARAVVTLENPLPATDVVNMGTAAKPDDWWSCDSPCVRIKQLTPLSGGPEGSFEIEYRPIAPTLQPAEHLLTITSRELGTFKYKLLVKATSAANLPTLRFEASLGSIMTETLTIKAYNAAKADYSCSLKRSDFFTLPKSVPVDAVSGWSGMDVAIPVTFEPTEIGELTDTLVVSGPGGAEYVTNIVANCVAPMPQGPLNFAQGGAAQDVTFRNFLSAPCAWNFSIDSTAFRTSAPNATVPAKSQGSAAVTFDPKEEHMTTPGGVVTAKLFVKCAAKPELAPFIFYLRGTIAAGGAAAAPAAAKKK